MKQNKKQSEVKLFLTILIAALALYAAMNFTLYFVIGFTVLLAVGALAYVRNPQFKAWIHAKLHIKAKSDQLCQYCKGNIVRIVNSPEQGICVKCHKIQKIK
ncbi:MAG: hypothetical protein WC554_19555 [Clostridia bacterium]|jgi:Zn-dependent protease with chaperone function